MVPSGCLRYRSSSGLGCSTLRLFSLSTVQLRGQGQSVKASSDQTQPGAQPRIEELARLEVHRSHHAENLFAAGGGHHRKTKWLLSDSLKQGSKPLGHADRV